MARERRLFVAAVAVALCQVALGLRCALGNADDYWLTIGIAWAAALHSVRQARPAASPTPGAGWQAVGALVTVVSLAVLAYTREYRGLDRPLPLLAGAGLAMAAAGAASWTRYRGELLFLALPLLNPVPGALRPLVEPMLVRWTALLTLLVHRAAGNPLTIDGSSLSTPRGTLDVLAGCSGLLGMSRLWVLAALIIALFPTTSREKVALFASATVVGFVVNVARMEVLVVTVMHGDDSSFDYWHVGHGASVFSVILVAAAAVPWWLILRRWKAAAPATLRPSS